MSTVTSANMNFLLDEVVSAVIFETFYDANEFLMPRLYSTRMSKRRRERHASTGGLSRFQEKNPTVAAQEDTINQQYQKDFVHKAFAKQVPIERELIDDEEWGTVQDIGQQLGVVAGTSMEEDAAAPFNDAFDGASYVGEDDAALCGTHTNAQGTNSQSNSGTDSLSMTSIKSTRTNMRKFTNYGGDKITVRPNMLMVPVDLEEESWEIVRSSGRPDNANNAANFYQGRFDLAVWDWLTDTNNWFMIDTRLMALNLIWYMRVSLESFGDGNLFTGVRRMGAYYRVSNGFRDWRWIFGHNVA